MRFSQISAALSALLVSGALAAPTESLALAKRQAGAGIHMVTCGPGTGEYAILVYCPDDSNCNHYPEHSNVVKFIEPMGWWTPDFTSRRDSPPFPVSGVTVQWRWSNKNARFKERAGTAINGIGGNIYNKWAIYRDDQHSMFKDNNGKECQSRFYFLPDDSVQW